MLFKFNSFSSYSTLAALLATLSGPLTAVQTASSSSSSSTAATSTTPTQSNEAENIFSQLPDEQLLPILAYLPDFYNDEQKLAFKRLNRIAKDRTLTYNIPRALHAKIATLTDDALAFFSETALRPQTQQTWRDINSALSQENMTILQSTNLFSPLSDLKNKTIAMKIAAHANAFFQISPHTDKYTQATILDHIARSIIGVLSTLSPQQIDALAQADFFKYDSAAVAKKDKMPLLGLEDSHRTDLIIWLSPFSADQITALASSRFFRDLFNAHDNLANLEVFILQIATWSPEKITAFGESATLHQHANCYDLAEKAKAVAHKTADQIRHFEAFLQTEIDTTEPHYIQLMTTQAMARVQDKKLPEFKASFAQLSADSFFKTTRPDHRLSMMLELLNNYEMHQERLDFIKAIKGTRLMHSPAQRTQDNGSVAELLKLTDALNQSSTDDDNATLLATITAMTSTIENISTQGGHEVAEIFCALAQAKKTPEEVTAFVEAAYAATENLAAKLSHYFPRIRLIERMAAAGTDPANMASVIEALSRHGPVFFNPNTPESGLPKLAHELLKLTSDQINLVANSPVFAKYRPLQFCDNFLSIIAHQQVSEAELTAKLDVISKLAEHCESYSLNELFNNLVDKSSQEVKGVYDTLFNPTAPLVDSKLDKYAKGSAIRQLTKYRQSDIEQAAFLLSHHFALNFFDNNQSVKQNILVHMSGIPTREVEYLFDRAAYLSAQCFYDFEKYMSLHTQLWKLQNPLR